MPDPVTSAALAAATVQLATQFLTKAGEGVATRAGEAVAEGTVSGAGALWRALKARLSGTGAERALARIEADPGDAKKAGALEVEVEEALDADPAWMAEVRRLVEQVGGAATLAQQHMTVSGQDAIGNQVAGERNTIDIRGRGAGT